MAGGRWLGAGVMAVDVFAVSLQRGLELAPVGIGLLVAILVVAAFGFRTRTRRRRKAARREGGGDWADYEASFANRRNSVRRDGAPVKVFLSATSLRNGTESGYVVDRSTGGLRVALAMPLVAGTTLLVRAQNAPDTVPWVSVVVRSCRNAGKHFELGCEFDQTPPWNVLLLFG